MFRNKYSYNIILCISKTSARVGLSEMVNKRKEYQYILHFINIFILAWTMTMT